MHTTTTTIFLWRCVILTQKFNIKINNLKQILHPKEKIGAINIIKLTVAE
jgi:hypothetical protein